MQYYCAPIQGKEQLSGVAHSHTVKWHTRTQTLNAIYTGDLCSQGTWGTGPP